MATQRGNFGRLLEPGLRKVFFETYKEIPEQYSQIFNVDNSKQAVEIDHRMAGLTPWNKKDTLGSTEYEDIIDGGDIIYKHETFSKGIEIEKELYDDEKYGVMNRRTKALSRTARYTVETEAISVLNNAFSAKGYDGVPLISDKHDLLGAKSKTTNLVGNYDLTEANLELAMKLAREQVDERGLKISMRPSVLVVGAPNEFKAKKIIKTAQSTDPEGNFAKNDINALHNKFKLVVLDHLEVNDGLAWFIMDPMYNQLNFFWREKLNFKGNHIDFDTDVAKYKGRMRFSYGYSDFRGWIGSTGK